MIRAALLVLVLAAALAAAPPALAADAAGTLVERFGERLGGAVTESESLLERPAGRTRPLDDPQPEALVGRRVTLVDADPSTRALDGRVRAAAPAPAPATGERRVLVVLLTFADAPEPSATPEQARDLVLDGEVSAGALFRHQSGGATTLSGEVRRVDLPDSLRGCSEGGIAAAADARLGDLSRFDHVMYALPFTRECAWGGYGDVGGRRSWINGSLAYVQLTAHELGHNMGVHHASALACPSGDVVPAALTGCAYEEYGDPFDVMGTRPRFMSSFHRAQLGQLPAGQAVEVRRSSTVTLGAGGPRLVLVPRTRRGGVATSWFAIEQRASAAPFDFWETGAPVTRGLSIRVVGRLTDATQTQLVDTTPETESREDAPLRPGATLRDEETGITIRAEAVGVGDAARAVVTMDPLDDLPPSAPGAVSAGASPDGTRVTLRWAAATDDAGAVTYAIERDGIEIGTTAGLAFEDTQVAGRPSATYRVAAVDAAGQRAWSAPVTVRIVPEPVVSIPDPVPPPPVTTPAATTPGVTATAESRDAPPAPRIRLASARWRRTARGWLVTATVTAPGATSLTATRGSTRIARARAARLKIRLRLPRSTRRTVLRVTATAPAGRSTTRLTLRRRG